MHIFPTDEEVEQAAGLLVNTYGVSAQLLGQLFDTEQRDQANSILQALGGTRLSSLDVARLLVQREGPALFSGSKEVTRELRLHILNGLPDERVQELFERNPPAGKNITAVSRMRRPLARMKWTSGKRWARDFVASAGFPLIFAGVDQREKVPTIHDVPPLKVPPKLARFQEQLKERMLQVLEHYGARTRCVVTLPTGGGKTRVAVEAFIDWMQPRFDEGKYLIWIAQSEELCEQAIACLEQMWGSREFVRPLRIYRFFGGRDIPTDDLRGGAVVASIQQLHNRIKKGAEATGIILKDTGAMIIDEAHRAVSAMYDTLLDRAEKICGPDLFPICGLTATPGRAGLNSSQEIVKLVDRFEVYLIKPELGEQYDANPLRYFREHRFLARARHVLYHSGCEYELTDDEVDEVKRETDLPAGFLKRLAADRQRNLLVIRRLLELPKGTPTLVYACTVEHAYFLAAILTAQGRRAAAVSADTPMTVRRAMVHDFKGGKIEALCNYGVLTTGFDAPKTECIALCRPTTSEVLYEQIIGRGVRGPAFGGTEECTIIDFADNIRRLGPPLAYKRFADFWSTEDTEGV
ncbi:MAG TPA: DEAD/DEAH box helicase family protein [Thermoanaerobaculia bacterium]|nr:DEAD/DEAH box helicase family protein [Thermoanaerobaculia bacterium]